MGQCLVFRSADHRPLTGQDSVRRSAARAEHLGVLRKTIGAAEAPRSLQEGVAPLRFGVPALDRALPWGGLPRGALHEICGTSAAYGFAAALAACQTGTRPILWCRLRQTSVETGSLFVLGLIPFGLLPHRLVLVETRKRQELLWAMEEGLRSGQPALVLGEADEISLVARRRLQLAAEAGGVTAFFLKTTANTAVAGRMAAGAMASSGALTRWVVTPPRANRQTRMQDCGLIGRSRWHVELAYCRAGTRRSWLMEWDHEAAAQQADREGDTVAAGRFIVVAELFDRPGELHPRLRRAS